MSRYEFEGKKPNHWIVVGWDRPMGTFFAQVLDQALPYPDEEPVLWLGTEFDEIQTVAELVKQVRPYGVVSERVAAQLQRDQRQDGSTSPGSLEALLHRLAGRLLPRRRD